MMHRQLAVVAIAVTVLGLLALAIPSATADDVGTAADSREPLAPGGGPEVASSLAAAAVVANSRDQSPAQPSALPAPSSFSETPVDVFAAKSEDPAESSARVAAEKAAAAEAHANPDAAWARYKRDMGARVVDALDKGVELSPELRTFADSVQLPARRAGGDKAASAGPGSSVEAKRARIFKRNLEQIARMNAQSGPDLAYGITDFTHLTEAEFTKMYLKPLPRPRPNKLAAAAEGGAEAALQPSGAALFSCNARNSAFQRTDWGALTPADRVDWSSYTTKAQQQGMCNTCTAFAAMSTIETAFILTWQTKGFNRLNVDLSEQELINCDRGDQCKDGGTNQSPQDYMSDATCGVRYESEVRYANKDTDNCGRSSRWTSGIVKVTAAPGNELGLARALMISPAVVLIGGSASQIQNYKTGVLNCGLKSAINHAVAIVGYRNRIAMTNGETWNIWTAKNSWGESWGEKGFFRMRKDCGGTGTLNMYANPSNLPLRSATYPPPLAPTCRNDCARCGQQPFWGPCNRCCWWPPL